jgi:hypothetical protein
MMKDLKEELKTIKKDLPPKWTSKVAKRCNCSEAYVSRVWNEEIRDRKNVVVTTYDIAIEYLEDQQKKRKARKQKYNNIKKQAS